MTTDSWTTIRDINQSGSITITPNVLSGGSGNNNNKSNQPQQQQSNDDAHLGEQLRRFVRRVFMKLYESVFGNQHMQLSLFIRVLIVFF